MVGSARGALRNGNIFMLPISGNRREVHPEDRRLRDKVADNVGKYEITESESLLFGENSGVTPDIKEARTAPSTSCPTRRARCTRSIARRSSLDCTGGGVRPARRRRSNETHARFLLAVVLTLLCDSRPLRPPLLAYIDNGEAGSHRWTGTKARLAAPVINAEGDEEKWLDVTQADNGRIVAVPQQAGPPLELQLVQGLGAQRHLDHRGPAEHGRRAASTSIPSASTSAPTARRWSTATPTATAVRTRLPAAPT